ncbi:MAG: hypothetical protein HOM21_09270 [Halobacteriovoraceae bacterium]|jgi:hypothetical protein|nr:hypothetical protein [Halobacteriovoraceae bacterium]
MVRLIMTEKADGLNLEIVMAERKFLHDLSNQLVVAQGMGNFVNKFLQDNNSMDEKVVERMGKAQKAVDCIITLVKERRAVLHELSDD